MVEKYQQLSIFQWIPTQHFTTTWILSHFLDNIALLLTLTVYYN